MLVRFNYIICVLILSKEICMLTLSANAVKLFFNDWGLWNWKCYSRQTCIWFSNFTEYGFCQSPPTIMTVYYVQISLLERNSQIWVDNIAYYICLAIWVTSIFFVKLVPVLGTVLTVFIVNLKSNSHFLRN